VRQALAQLLTTSSSTRFTTTLGQTKKDAGESGKHPENKNKVATDYSHPLSKGGSSSGHYSGHAETYHNVGEAMGKAMVKLLQSK